MKKKILLTLSHLLVAVLASLGTLWLFGEYSKLAELETVIEEYYVEDVDLTEVEDAASHAMIAALGDRWSYYIPADEYATHLESMQNAYVGIGITILQMEDGSGFEILEVSRDSGAEAAGLKVGDVITAIGGQSVAGMSTNDARNLVRGKEGTLITITVLRDEEEQTLSVERRNVELEVATAQLLDDGVGLVVIYNFDDRCSQETIAAIEEMRAAGAEKLVFDVRFNPGGYAHELVALLDYLLPEGEIFRTVDYSGAEEVEHSDGACVDLPMAVLVNKDSYSAAEFFAAALREYDAAVIVGEQTSGKGYFQNTIPLSDGSAVGLSTGKYFTPKGVNLEGVGITPDVEVTVDEETNMGVYYGTLAPEQDLQLQAAMEALE